jgi:hypothetical protein
VAREANFNQLNVQYQCRGSSFDVCVTVTEPCEEDETELACEKVSTRVANPWHLIGQRLISYSKLSKFHIVLIYLGYIYVEDLEA